jgi:hypothetical protein
MPIYVPIHPALAASIAACPSPELAIIAKEDGAYYTKEGLGNFFREAVDAAGILVTKRGSEPRDTPVTAYVRRRQLLRPSLVLPSPN